MSYHEVYDIIKRHCCCSLWRYFEPLPLDNNLQRLYMVVENDRWIPQDLISVRKRCGSTIDEEAVLKTLRDLFGFRPLRDFISDKYAERADQLVQVLRGTYVECDNRLYGEDDGPLLRAVRERLVAEANEDRRAFEAANLKIEVYLR